MWRQVCVLERTFCNQEFTANIVDSFEIMLRRQSEINIHWIWFFFIVYIYSMPHIHLINKSRPDDDDVDKKREARIKIPFISSLIFTAWRNRSNLGNDILVEEKPTVSFSLYLSLYIVSTICGQRLFWCLTRKNLMKKMSPFE